MDEVPAKRILDSIVQCQVRQKLRPLVFPFLDVKTVPCPIHLESRETEEPTLRSASLFLVYLFVFSICSEKG